MKIVKLKGGLGNQMFQYSFAKLLMLKSGADTAIDLSGFNVDPDDSIRKPLILKFNISLKVASKENIKSLCLIDHPYSRGFNYKMRIIFEMIFNKEYFFEKDMAPKNIEMLNKFSYFDGYWQSWRYVDSVFDELKKDLIPKEKISIKTQSFIEKAKNESSVFVGIRRGDYLKEKKLYGETNAEYYINGMKYIEKYVANPVYYIFSNDIDWVEQNMDFGDRKIVYRRNEDIVDDFEELILMSNCKHSIIQNSTFHWWGARLNYYDGKIVIAPENWFANGNPIEIIPPEWIMMDN